MPAPGSSFALVSPEEFDDMYDAYHKAAVDEVQAFREVDEAKVAMDILAFKIEESVIQNAGSEKAVGSTEAARNRAFELARSQSPAYQAAKDSYEGAKAHFRYCKHVLRLLDMRGQFIIASTKR